ncbi:hypothetical protein HDU80_000711 [Chytriomyces hyalinus]|nr:hypothetical protein HDU80_000711 [Chytriomyces hyalinus]
MSSDDEQEDARPFLDTVLAEYAVKNMKAGKFRLNLFLKKGAFTSSNQEDEAKQTLQAVMKFANEERKKAAGVQKKCLRRTLETLDSMDFDDETAEWFQYWDKLKSAESKQRNRRKRDSEADCLLTAAVAKVRQQEQDLLEKPKKKARLQLIESIKRICDKPPLGQIPACLGSIQACFKTEAAYDNSQALVIDLRRNNKDIFSSIPPETVEEYISYIAERWDATSSSEMQDFLGEFFNGMATRDASKWSKYLEDFIVPDNVQLQNAMTNTISIRAILDPTAPLQDKKTLESRMLNDFIHPLFKESLFVFGNETVWHSGVGKMRGKDLPLAYFEGARPASQPSKQYSDDMKIRSNCVSILRQEVLDMESLRKKMPNFLSTFGAQYFNDRLSFFVADCFESIFFHTFDEVNVPKNSSEICGFADLYESMFGWSVLVGDMVKELEAAERQPRRSRKSFFSSFTALARQDIE